MFSSYNKKVKVVLLLEEISISCELFSNLRIVLFTKIIYWEFEYWELSSNIQLYSKSGYGYEKRRP